MSPLPHCIDLEDHFPFCLIWSLLGPAAWIQAPFSFPTAWENVKDAFSWVTTLLIEQKQPLCVFAFLNTVPVFDCSAAFLLLFIKMWGIKTNCEKNKHTARHEQTWREETISIKLFGFEVKPYLCVFHPLKTQMHKISSTTVWGLNKEKVSDILRARDQRFSHCYKTMQKFLRLWSKLVVVYWVLEPKRIFAPGNNFRFVYLDVFSSHPVRFNNFYLHICTEQIFCS